MSELTKPQMRALSEMVKGGADEKWELTADELGDLVDQELVCLKATVTDRGREVLADLSLQEVISHIASADYELGCAARRAEVAAATTLSAELTRRRCDLVKLREDVRKQIGDASC